MCGLGANFSMNWPTSGTSRDAWWKTNFWKKDGIDETSTIEDIRELIVSKYSNRVVLNKSSQIEIVDVS